MNNKSYKGCVKKIEISNNFKLNKNNEINDGINIDIENNINNNNIIIETSEKKSRNNNFNETKEKNKEIIINNSNKNPRKYYIKYIK